ncbi:MAG: alpha/beta hydrolase [Pseudomonadota bacterium]
MKRLLGTVICVLLLSSCTGTGVLNALASTSGYQPALNLIYDEGRDLRADIYQPDGAKAAPVVVYFGGGRWTTGDKQDYEFVGEALASQGFVVVIPNLRFYPDVKFPAFVEDAARAVKWTRSVIGRYGADPDKLFVMGHSSGAHIASILALNDRYLKEVGGTRRWLRGMIGLAGPYDFMPITDPDLRDIFGPPEKFDESQPIRFVDGENPPLLLMHGEDDEVVWIKNTRNLAQAVRRAGGVAETVYYPELAHTRIIGVLGAPLRGFADVLQQIAQFVNKYAYTDRTSKPSDIKTTPLR